MILGAERKLGIPLIVWAIACGGCGDPAYPATMRYHFAPHVVLEGTDNTKTYKLSDEQAKEMDVLLQGTFGTPRDPQVKCEEAAEELGVLQLDVKAMAEGSKLYRAQCLDCHGTVGNGEGQGAQFLNPLPRDYRQGKFKFVSTARKDASGKQDTSLASYPSREDLRRTIKMGLPGAGMTAFEQKNESNYENLVSYIIHLAIRGQVEYRLTRQWLDEDEKPTEKDVAKEIKEIVKQWAADSQSPYIPNVPWEEVEPEGERSNWNQGRDLYLNKAGCPDCHGKNGKALVAEVPTIATMRDDWGYAVRPRNFREDAFRGGKRPIDLFNRIRLGMKPSRMQASDQGKLTDADVWHLVGYVRSLEGKN